MSNIRREHPGYYGVVIGAALPWYFGLGVIFTFLHGEIARSADYKLALAYVPLTGWGIWYMALGTALAIAGTVPRVPHKYVRALMSIGWFCTCYFLVTFVVTLVDHGLATPTIVVAWLTLLVVEYKAIFEAESNPLMGHHGPQ